MRVSVVIPAYNEENYIAPCLRSLMNQTVRPDEIIVVDNNSTDATPRIAAAYNVTVLRENVQGTVPARDRGFNAARGPAIARCDADCILPRDWISRIKQDMLQHPEVEGITGTAEFYDFPFKNLKPLFASVNEQFIRRTGHYPMFGSNMAITKAGWNTIKSNVCRDSIGLHEDIDLGIHLHQVGMKIYFDPGLIAAISSRRLRKHPRQILFDYSRRIIKTIEYHESKAQPISSAP